MEILPLFDAPRRLRKFFNCTLAQTSGASYHLGDVGALSEAEPESDLEDAGLTLSGDISRDLRICLQKARRMGDYHQSVIFQFPYMPYINDILDYERLQLEGLVGQVFFSYILAWL